MCFRINWLPKIWLDKCLKSFVSEDPETNNMANGSKYFCNLNGSTFTIFIKHFDSGCVGKGLFYNTQNPEPLLITLTTDDKHYLVNRDKLTQPIQKPIPQKQKNFSEFLLAFLKSILNFKHLPKKDDRHS